MLLQPHLLLLPELEVLHILEELFDMFLLELRHGEYILFISDGMLCNDGIKDCNHSLNSLFLRSLVRSFMKSTRLEPRYLVFSLSAKSLMIL